MSFLNGPHDASIAGLFRDYCRERKGEIDINNIPNETPLKGMKIKNGLALIKIGSHRARQKLENLLGRLPNGYFDWHRQGEWREVTPEELEKVKAAKIKGITQSRWSDGLRPYINWPDGPTV